MTDFLTMIAITIGILAFCGWTAAMVAVGILNQRKRDRESRKRVAAGRRIMQEVMERRGVPEKVEPKQPVASAETRGRYPA